MSLVFFVDYFSCEPPQEIIPPVGVLKEMIHEPGGCERYSGGERPERRSPEDGRRQLLTEHIIRKIIVRHTIKPYDTISILQMPTYAPLCRRCRIIFQIEIACLFDDLGFVGQHS